MADGNRILNMELSEEDETLLRESLTTWKEETYANLVEEVEELKQQKIEELEEANIEYQEQLKEEYAEKMLVALDEMREEIKAEVIAEMVDSNPDLQILEKVKELVAPTLNEEYFGNIYAEEIQTLKEENEALKEYLVLEAGAEKLAELLAPYDETTQNLLLTMIKEGGPEEVTEQFYEIIETLKGINEEEDEEDEEEDYDDEDEEKDDIDDEDEDDEDEDDEDEDEDFEESFTEDDSTEEEIKEETKKKINSVLNEMKGLI
jgi:hypothetical protein